MSPKAHLPEAPRTDTQLTDTQAMQLALDCARKGVRGANPLVGAVIADATGQVLATGWHRGAGNRGGSQAGLKPANRVSWCADHHDTRSTYL